IGHTWFEPELTLPRRIERFQFRLRVSALGKHPPTLCCGKTCAKVEQAPERRERPGADHVIRTLRRPLRLGGENRRRHAERRGGPLEEIDAQTTLLDQGDGAAMERSDDQAR